MKKHEIMRP